VSDSVKIKNLYECEVPYLKELFDSHVYPWELLPLIKETINELLNTGIEGFTELKEGVLVGQNVKISETATIDAPAIIGHNTEIRPGAYIRGNLITGSGCVLGNSSEFKNAILLDKAQIPHYNYVGDSVLGNRAHLGAGSICSNLKSDGKNVVIHADADIETGLRKVGAFLADGADVGCQCVLNPGTVIGKRTSVYPLTSVRGVVKEDCIVKSMQNIVERK
jgi:NDP-sugar pyrophosphorylase family protein